MIRLKELRRRNNMSQSELAQSVGVSRSTIAMWETEKSQPDNESIICLSDFFNVSSDYLLGRADKGNDSPEREKGIRIPVIGNSAAGLPISAIQKYIDDNDPDTWEEISESMAASGEYVAIKIKGDSMEPRIMDGDIIIVRLQDDVDSGDTAIVIVNGDEATCKKIKKMPEGIMLISNNSNYEPMFYSNKDIQTLPVRIYGKVVEVRGKL